METKLKLSEIQSSDNVAALLSEKELGEIGAQVHQTYEKDKQSRRKWEERMEDATDLALQVVEKKSYPWENSSNVKFPLLTIASIQFAARIYPALVKAPDAVKFRVQGRDENGAKAARAQRISRHMSYQLLEEDEHWEEGQDRAYMVLPIVGSVFKKSFYDPVCGHNRSEVVLPMDLVVHYYAKNLETAARKTEVFYLGKTAIRERELRKLYLELEVIAESTEGQTRAGERTGITPPPQDDDQPRKMLEQHTTLDLDGDGYPEPYVITIDATSRQVRRIVHRFKTVVSEQSVQVERLKNEMLEVAHSVPAPTGQETETELRAAQAINLQLERMEAQIQKLESAPPKVLRIEPVEHYTKIGFIPSPDGSFYDIGFGVLLSPLNDSVNTLINQLTDSGTLQNGSAGFIGKGARMKGGKIRFSPNEWKRVDVAGSTLKESLVPLPVNQPSTVLFQLLGLLIEYTQRVSSVTEAMSGNNPGQNTPAYNMNAMLEQGLQVFNGIFKRVYRSFRSELRKLYALNGLYLDELSYFEYQDADYLVTKSDYQADPKDLIPAADPNAFSSQEKQAKAQMIAERSQMVPGYDPIKVEQRLHEAMDIPDAAEIFPVVQGEDGRMQLVFQPGPDPEFQIKQAEEQRRTLDAQAKHELNQQELAGKLALIEVQIIREMAEAAKIADAPELARMELALKDVMDQRKHITEREKANATRADREVERASGNGSPA